MTSNKVTYLLNAMAMMIVLVTPQMGGGFSGGFSGGPLIYGSGLQSVYVDGTKYNRQ